MNRTIWERCLSVPGELGKLHRWCMFHRVELEDVTSVRFHDDEVVLVEYNEFKSDTLGRRWIGPAHWVDDQMGV